MNFDALPERLRTAGVAWVVRESSEYLDDEGRAATRIRAHHWAVMRNLPIETDEDHDAATLDAVKYAAEHEADITEFLDYRDREKRRQR